MLQIVDPSTKRLRYQDVVQKYWRWLLSDYVDNPKYYDGLYLMRTCYDFQTIFSPTGEISRKNIRCQAPHSRNDEVEVERQILIPYIDACFEDYPTNEFGGVLTLADMQTLANQDLKNTNFTDPIVQERVPAMGKPQITVSIDDLKRGQFLVDSGPNLFDLETKAGAPLVDKMEDPLHPGLHHAYAKGHYVIGKFDDQEKGKTYNIRSSAQGPRGFRSAMSYTLELI